MRISDWSSDVCSSDLRGDVLVKLKSRLSGESDNLAQLKDDERSIRQLIESLKKTLADLPPNVSPSDKPFTSLKGKLPWPVRGALLAPWIGRASRREGVCTYV